MMREHLLHLWRALWTVMIRNEIVPDKSMPETFASLMGLNPFGPHRSPAGVSNFTNLRSFSS